MRAIILSGVLLISKVLPLCPDGASFRLVPLIKRLPAATLMARVSGAYHLLKGFQPLSKLRLEVAK
ncbi:MAG: hypothetical protein EAZ70_05035 [Runella slithyformis]|nr:MAG: hypothetical protein EAY79_04695 [Runella slithyformis]TAF28478.1 MAG: hypothetical protein EAZ70_05035 [Runella slithyformis]